MSLSKAFCAKVYDLTQALSWSAPMKDGFKYYYSTINVKPQLGEGISPGNLTCSSSGPRQ